MCHGEDAPQMAVGDAKSFGNGGQVEIVTGARGLVDHARRMLRQHLR